MSTHYLCDPFASLATAKIIDTVPAPAGVSVFTSSFVIRVPDNLRVSQPSDVADLVTKKYQAVLDATPGFSNIVYDPLLDPSNLSTLVSPARYQRGFRGGVALHPNTVGNSLIVTLGTALAGPPVTTGILVWEEYLVTASDPKADRYTRTYTEQSPTLTVSATTDGLLANVTPVTSGSTIVFPFTGNTLLIRFENATANKVYLGGWSFVY